MSVLCRWFFRLYLIIIFSLPIGDAKAGANSTEYKLLVNPVVFTEQESGVRKFWQRITSTAQNLGYTASGYAYVPTVRWVNYFDTKERALKRQNYILRQRVKHTGREGKKATGQVMLKYRREGNVMPELSYITKNGVKNKSVKQEWDRVGFAAGKAGQEITYASLSYSKKNVPLENLSVLRDYVENFPVLATLGISLDAKIVPVGSAEGILEYTFAPGRLFLHGEAIPIEIALWIDADTGKSLLAEISWSIDGQMSDDCKQIGDKFFSRVQEDMQDILWPGQTKESFISGERANGR